MQGQHKSLNNPDENTYSHPARSFMSPKLHRNNESLVKVTKNDKTNPKVGNKTTKNSHQKKIAFDDIKS